MGLGRFELPTSPLSGVRSNQLSYRPELTCLFFIILRCFRIFPSVTCLVHAPSKKYSAPCLIRNIRRYLISLVQTITQLNLLGSTIQSRNLCERLTSKPCLTLFKEVIQPQVPLRLPCYDFTPVIDHTVVSALPKVKQLASGATNSHGVTGGVYKARERIHRDILIRDY